MSILVHSSAIPVHSCSFLRIPVPFLWTPADSSGMGSFLQESVGHGEVLILNASNNSTGCQLNNDLPPHHPLAPRYIKVQFHESLPKRTRQLTLLHWCQLEDMTLACHHVAFHLRYSITHLISSWTTNNSSFLYCFIQTLASAHLRCMLSLNSSLLMWAAEGLVPVVPGTSQISE